MEITLNYDLGFEIIFIQYVFSYETFIKDVMITN